MQAVNKLCVVAEVIIITQSTLVSTTWEHCGAELPFKYQFHIHKWITCIKMNVR